MERDDPKLRIWTMQKKEVYGPFSGISHNSRIVQCKPYAIHQPPHKTKQTLDDS